MIWSKVVVHSGRRTLLTGIRGHLNNYMQTILGESLSFCEGPIFVAAAERLENFTPTLQENVSFGSNGSDSLETMSDSQNCSNNTLTLHRIRSLASTVDFVVSMAFM